MFDARLLPLLGVLACVGGNARADADAATHTAESAFAPQESASLQPARPPHLARVVERAPTRFAHEPHLRFECDRCHAQVAGHERHANVACRQCHEAPPPTGGGAPAAECNACHHARTQPYGCMHCHERPAADPSSPVVRVEFRIGAHTVERELALPHALHERLPCTGCHAAAGRAPTVTGCNSCHERHHHPAANCSACHPLPRPGVHTAGVHRGCGGTGCHQDAAVLALPLVRAVCLSCHPAQSAHEPEGDCAGCHHLQAPGSAERSRGRS